MDLYRDIKGNISVWILKVLYKKEDLEIFLSIKTEKLSEYCFCKPSLNLLMLG